MRCQSLKEVLALWQARLEADQTLRDYIGRPFNLTVDDARSEWTVNPVPPVSIAAASGSADCKITISEKDLLNVVNGESNPQALFAEGKLRVTGIADQALRLHRLLVCQ